MRFDLGRRRRLPSFLLPSTVDPDKKDEEAASDEENEEGKNGVEREVFVLPRNWQNWNVKMLITIYFCFHEYIESSNGVREVLF
jgi:hypothetical protein